MISKKYHIADKCAISRNKKFFDNIQTTKIREIVRPFLKGRKYSILCFLFLLTYTHNHIRIIATNITIKYISMCIYKMMMMFQTKMFENFIHWTSFGTVKFWTLYWFIRTDFFMISSILGR